MTHNTDPHTTQTPYGACAGYGPQTPYGYGQPNTYGYAQPGGHYGYPTSPAPASQKKLWAWVTGIFIVLVFVGGAVMIAPFAILTYQTSQMTSDIDEMTGDQTERILSDDLTVDMGDITIDSNRYSDSGEMAVTLTNKSDERATFNVEIEAVSESGDRIADGSAYATSLAPGQSITTDVTFYVDGGASKYDLEDAEFTIIKVSMY